LVISGVGTAFQNTLFKRIKDKIDGTGKRERRREQLLDNLKEKKKCWNFNPYPANVENRVSS